MITTTQIQICSFCTKPLETPDHPCPHILFSLTNIIASVRQDSPSLLGDVHNLVFQGGGVKGLSYLGSLQQLQAEGEKEGKDFLAGVQRIAGTSAGSMVALYLGLGLSLVEIEKLMRKDFVKLLDESLILNVAVEFHYGWNVEKKYKAKKVFLKAMEYFKKLEERLEKGDKTAEKEVGDLVRTIMTYLMSRELGVAAADAINKALWLAEKLGFKNKIAIQATEWLLNMLKPKPQDTEKKLLKSDLKSDSSSDCHSIFEEIVSRECEKVLDEIKKEEEEEHESQENHNKGLRLASSTEKQIENQIEKQSSNMKKDALKYLAINRPDSELNQDLEQDQEIELDQDLKENQEKRLAQPLQSSYQLEGKTLYHALGEIIYFITLSQQNVAGIQKKLGLFDGSLVKKELIEEPISKAVGKEAKHITFKELWDLNSAAGRNFKKFFITAFNMETFRTEVFSVEHTPNVVIADAVRASMSIPVFFNPVTIRERTEKGLTDRKIYSSKGAELVVHYMDGGVLDNYPIWIFDDFKYCVQDIPGFKPLMRYTMQNPRTLGFRLMDKRIIDIYTDPYLDPERKRMKQINDEEYQESFMYQIGLLFKTEINQTQENEHIKRGDCARTAYVDNLGMSAIQFELTDKQKEAMIKAGADSVTNYKLRAQKGFVGEGEAYF